MDEEKIKANIRRQGYKNVCEMTPISYAQLVQYCNGHAYFSVDRCYAIEKILKENGAWNG